MLNFRWWQIFKIIRIELVFNKSILVVKRVHNRPNRWVSLWKPCLEFRFRSPNEKKFHGVKSVCLGVNPMSKPTLDTLHWILASKDSVTVHLMCAEAPSSSHQVRSNLSTQTTCYSEIICIYNLAVIFPSKISWVFFTPNVSFRARCFLVGLAKLYYV